MKNKVFMTIAVIIAIIILIGISTSIIATIIYYVWNLAISDIFTLKQITFLQSYLFSLGLSIVVSLFRTKITSK